ncbi:MAG: hypothetical protein AAF490_30565 [Chloroflexota bacterium]
MESEVQSWDYCKIEVRYFHSTRTFTENASGPPEYWFKFVAYAYTESRGYVAGASEKVPLPALTYNSIEPKPQIAQHQAIFELLIRKLKDEGWQKTGKVSGEWWEVPFKRPTQPNLSFFQKIKSIWVGKNG